MRSFLAIMLGVSLVAGAAEARIYKWVDASGAVRYSDKPPADQSAQTMDVTNGPASPDSADPSCQRAVAKGKFGIKTLLQVGDMKADAGELTRAKFIQMKKDMSALNNHLSVTDCAAATGANRAFYDCLDETSGQIIQCAVSHRPNMPGM